MARLGEILEASGTPPDKIREGLESAVIYGGRLGTNLLEQGAVSEEAVAQALAAQHGCPALWGEIGVDQRALGVLKPDVVDRLEAVPLRLDGRRLTLLVRDPRDLARIDELSFATGKEVRAVVVTESRLWELMRRHYAVYRPLRGVEALASRQRPERTTGPGLPPGADLMDEKEFAALYDQTTGAARTPAADDDFQGALVSTEEVLAALQVDASQHAQADGRAIRLTPPRAVEAPPLSFEEAARELAGVADRDAIARVVLRCARSRCRRALLLTVRAEHADGWEGLGEGLTPQTVARIHVPLDQPGIFQTVIQTRAHALGPLQKTAANVRFLRALGGGAPRTSFAMPILARGRVVNVLYADNGRGELVDSTGVGELLILASKIGHSYEVLISRAQ